MQNNLIAYYIHGIFGLLKAVLGFDKAPRQTVIVRWWLCKQCKHMNHKIYRCEECGCFLPAKVRVASESCIIDRWKEHYK